MRIPLILCFIFFVVNGLIGQSFKALVSGGLLLSQVAEDKLAGFNKVGFDAGGGVYYEFKSQDKFGIKLSLNQFGSKRKGEVINSTFQNLYTVHLNAVGTSVFYRKFLNPGWNKQKLIFVNISTGIQRILPFNNMIKEFSSKGVTILNTNQFKSFTYFVDIGCGYRVSKKLEVLAGLTYHLTSVYSGINGQNLKPYYLSLQFDYTL